MQARPERLGELLARQGPPPLCLVYGEEPLQRTESVDAVRAAARATGVGERVVFDAAVGIDWPRVAAEAGSLSLFASRRLIEIHLGAKKPDRHAAATLATLAAQQGEDVVLVTAETLQREEQNSEWFRAIDARGMVVQCRPLDGAALRPWLASRAAARGLELADDAVEILALRAEGNLLAAAQEIEKLKLLAEGTQIDVDTVHASVADSARFDVFGLIDAALNGEAAHALRMLEGLRGEGVEPPVILWALAREIRLLATIAQQYAQGMPLEKAFSSARPPVWDKRRPLVSKALQRLSASRWAALLQDAQQIDAQIKGQAPGDAWSGLSLLTLNICGQRLGLNR